MAMQLRKAARSQAKTRLGLSGPSGAGKTTSALLIAYGLCGDWSKIAVVDTENRSADLYANHRLATGEVLGEFNVLPMDAPYAPERYIEAIKTCEEAGIEVCIVDSISHEWEGKGGCLEIHEKLGGQFKHWAEVTPRHRKFIDAILQSKMHVITCARAKTDYAVTVDGGKTKVEKVGLKDVTREGFDYELTADLDLDLLHNARASKDRTGLFMDQPAFMPSVETGKALRAWCEMGAPEPAKATVPAPQPAGGATTPLEAAKSKIEAATTLDELAEIGASLTGSMPEADLKLARQAWLKRKSEIEGAGS